MVALKRLAMVVIGGLMALVAAIPATAQAAYRNGTGTRCTWPVADENWTAGAYTLRSHRWVEGTCG